MIIGAKVVYIGPNWPERIGWQGVVKWYRYDEKFPNESQVGVDFGLEYVVNCYEESLRKVEK